MFRIHISNLIVFHKCQYNEGRTNSLSCTDNLGESMWKDQWGWVRIGGSSGPHSWNNWKFSLIKTDKNLKYTYYDLREMYKNNGVYVEEKLQGKRVKITQRMDKQWLNILTKYFELIFGQDFQDL